MPGLTGFDVIEAAGVDRMRSRTGTTLVSLDRVRALFGLG
jgi:hypothetical protein